MPSPDGVAKPAEPRLPRDQDRMWRHVPLHDFAWPLRLQFSPSRVGWLQPLRVGWLHQRKCFAFPLLYRDAGGRRWTGHAALHDRGRRGNDRRKGGIENNALRPFPIGVNADDGRIGVRSLNDRQSGQACVQKEHQSEQYSADIKEISRQGHTLLRRGAAPASRSNPGTVVSWQEPPSTSTSSNPRHQRGAMAARKVRSAPTDAIHRATAVRGRADTADAGRRHRTRDRPRAQHDACPKADHGPLCRLDTDQGHVRRGYLGHPRFA